MSEIPRRHAAPACNTRSRLLAAALAGCTVLAACSPQQLLVRQVADQLAGQGAADEEDPGLAREAGAFYLKLSESVLRETPGHAGLATAVAGGFTQYAYAFVAFEADRLAATDARAARRQRERAARLYLRAQGHAMAALEARHPGFAQRLAVAADGATAPPLQPEDIGLAYWAAAAWGAHIALSKDQPEVVADLPQAVRLAGWAYALQPDHGHGDLASLMGTLEAARPGGSTQQARLYFDRAEAAAGGRSAGVFVARAEALALPAGDRPAFEALLRQAQAAARTRRDLGNQVMAERADWLLASVDDLF